ncbi:MAG: CDP-alcohol phosphatidyltransferase family protein [Desulfobulbaceae bacterium]|uniref:CDP-alcohol phosphatidyltransferase family protein n=1 Tax=Candidatus Desulfobia pelagia TaxID=2841692 RepID=A0A8J6TBK9_9BACT|nr:CDP-alcohol phosphatidyltransferase family protein [Candidatus Desulfobia pelagia]
MVNIPNILSCLRLIIAPLLLYLAWNGKANLFLIFFVAALITDCLDGFIARMLNQTSELGARLDSLGDNFIYVTVPPSIWWLRPDIIQREDVWVSIVLFSYILPVICGFLKFKRLISYHTFGAKLSAVLLSVSIILMLIDGPSLPFRVSSLVFLFTAIEEISMTFILPVWQADVPTFIHALRIRRKVLSD